jgi:hypothetical protein
MLFQRRIRINNELLLFDQNIPEDNVDQAELLPTEPDLISQEPISLPQESRGLFRKPTLSSPDPGHLYQGTGDEELDKVIDIAGYAYDPIQDIFYSTMNPWQRNVGYCRLYDEAAAPLGMIMDCEPVYFEYDNRKWMISFWKGQYDMVCGCEIGVYTGGLQLNIPNVFTGTFYNSVNDAERLQMSYTIQKNGQTLFTRNDRHWWLTGFKLGEFAEPSELTMDIKLTLANAAMRDAFLDGFRKAGYADHEYSLDGNTVSFIFDFPHTSQPTTRTPSTDQIIQEKNRLLCEMYEEITHQGNTTQEKLKILKEEAPELYEKALKIGSNKQFFQVLYLLIITAMYLLMTFSQGKPSDKYYFSRKKTEILNKLKQKIEELKP